MIDLTNQLFRQYIYQDRSELEDFNIHNTSTMDGIMYRQITHSVITDLSGASRCILDIMNNVYYITTLILMDETAITHMRDYIIIAEHAGSAYKDITMNNTYGRYFECITMAMVCNYLYIIDSKKYSKSDNILISSIWDYHHIHFNDNQTDGKARFLFYNNFMQREDMLTLYVSREAFKPLKSKEELKAIDNKLRAIQGEDNTELSIEKIIKKHRQLENEIDKYRRMAEEAKEEKDRISKQLSEANAKNNSKPTNIENSEIEPLNSWAKIIFFATVLSTAYDARYTNQMQLSEFICFICGGRPTTFQPRISKLDMMIKNETNNSGDNFSSEIINAAKELVKRLELIPKENKSDSKIKRYIDDIKSEFCLED